MFERNSPKQNAVDRGRRIVTDGGAAAASGGGRVNQQSEAYAAGPQTQFGEATNQGFQSKNGGDLGFQYLMREHGEARDSFMANYGDLRYEEWKEINDRVIEVRKEALNLVADLRAAGLTTNEDIANLVTRWQTSGRMSEDADITMNPATDTNEEDPGGFGLAGAPMWMFQKDWRIDRRLLLASRNAGGMDIGRRASAGMTRAVASTIEYAMLNGISTPIDGYTMPGFLTHPDRNQVTGSGWADDDGNDADNVRADLLAAIERMENDEYDGGGYYLYLARREWQRLRRLLADFGGGFSGETNMRTRISEEFDTELGRVRVSKHIPDGQALMFQPSTDVVEVGIAEDIQPVQWEAPHGWVIFMKVLAAMNLKLASTQDGQMGVAHLTNL